jgi:hypothetical protein
MISLVVKAAPRNDKGITHTVTDQDGYIVGSVRESDLADFLNRQNEVNQKPGIFEEKREYGGELHVLYFRVKWSYRNIKSYRNYVLYKENGKYILHEESVGISAHYQKPEVVKLVGENMILETNEGNFVIKKYWGGHLIEKL